MSATRTVGAPAALSTFLTSSSPLAKWSSKVESAEQAASAARAAPIQQAAAPAPVKRNIFSAIKDVYARRDDEAGGQSRLRTLDEEAESIAPAAAGETSKVMQASDRNNEMLAVAAAVIASAYGDQVDRNRTAGAFDVAVFSNVLGAANTIAPGKSLSSLSKVELQAIVTSAIQGSNSAFLQSVGGAPRNLVDATKNSSSGDKVASEFMKDGAFNASSFLAKTQGSTMGVSQLMSATPMGAKIALLTLAAEKASELVEKLGQKQSEWTASIKEQVGVSVEHRLQMLEQGGESDGSDEGEGGDGQQRKRKRNTLFEKPPAPGAP